MNTKPLFVTGIGTAVGKTIASAVLCEQLQADYWKPVQAGDLDFTDSDQVRDLVSNSKSQFHPEAFRLQLPASPHQSARKEGLEIHPEDFKLPKTDNRLLIEGAGGIFVPLSLNFFMIDLIKQFDAEVVLVVKNYLGCINHTLLTMQAIIHHQLHFKHVVMNGDDFSVDTLDAILQQIPEGTTFSHLPSINPLTAKAIKAVPIQIPNLLTNPL